MKNIRQGVFETNSSSSHSFSVYIETEGVLETLPVNKDGVIVFDGGDYSDAEFSFYTALDKANAIAVYIVLTDDEVVKANFEKVVLKHTGASHIEYDIVLQGKKLNSYMSREFRDYLLEAVGCKRDIKNFVFNPKSIMSASFGYDG
jgi:hypothetical protein